MFFSAKYDEKIKIIVKFSKLNIKLEKGNLNKF